MVRNILSRASHRLGRRGIATVEYAVLAGGLIGFLAVALPAMPRGINFTPITAQVICERVQFLCGQDLRLVADNQGVRRAAESAPR